jgi:ankyrin repeat protein
VNAAARWGLKLGFGLLGIVLFFFAIAALPEYYPDHAPLEQAIFDGDAERLRQLLDRGGDPNTRSATLSEVCWWLQPKNSRRGYSFDFGERDPLLIIALQKDQPAMARLLLQRGADPNARDEYGRSVMHAARLLGNAELIREIQAKGGRD